MLRTRARMEKLEKRVNEVGFLCIGLDPSRDDLPEYTADAARTFCLSLIEATKPVAAAYKPNAAFFEVFGAAGWTALEDVCKAVPKEIPVVLDAKRGDIGNTAQAYAEAAYAIADIVTVSPYMGTDSVAPFLRDPTKGVFALCKTSNPGSNDLQTLELVKGGPLYVHVAALAASWGPNVGLVVGATDSVALRAVRAECPDVWLLAPGLGAQGGDMLQAVSAMGGRRMLLPMSRAIARAADPGAAAAEFASAIQKAAEEATKVSV